MPKFRITDPTGKVYDVEAPEGATEQDALKYLQDNLPKPEAPQTLQQRSADVFGIDPTMQKRGALLPFGINKEGETELAIPQLGVDFLESFLLPGHVKQGGSYTFQDVAKMGLDYNPMAKSPATRTLPTKRQFIKNAPSKEAIGKKSQALYKQAEAKGIKFGSDDFADLLAKMENTIIDEGGARGLTDKTLAAFSNISKNVGKSPTFREMETMRKQLNIARQSLDPADKRLASMLVEQLDEFVGGMDGIPKQARALWQRRAKVNTIEALVERAGRSASGLENGLRTEFRSLLNNKRKISGFTAAEKEAMEKVVKGGPWRSTLRMLSHAGPQTAGSNRYLGTAIGMGGGSAIGSTVGGPAGAAMGAVAVPAAGHLAGRAAVRSTQNAADYAKALAATGGKSPQLRTPTPAMVTPLLGTLAPQQPVLGPNGGIMVNGEEIF